MSETSVLSDTKRLLLQKMLRGETKVSDDDESVRSRLPGTPVPISQEQKSVWLHSAMAANGTLYNESVTIHRKGAFSIEVMQRTLQEILRRHESWRTSFALVDGEILQTIQSDLPIDIPVVDLTGLPKADRDAAALEIATDDARKPFELTKAPLFRMTAVKISDDEHRLYLTLHHIIFDGVSLYQIVVPQLAQIYDAFAAGRRPNLAESKLQYGDYAVWRERQASGEVVSKQLDYWRRALRGHLPTLQLPTDRPRPPIPSYRGSMEVFSLSSELTEALKALSRKQGVTLYILLLAAFKSLLHRYTGQDDIIIGGVTDARRRPELQNVVGYFLNSLALRTQPSGDLPFCDFVLRTRDAVTGALDASNVPFDRIVRDIQPKRDPSLHPLFQVFFSVQPPAPRLGESWDLTQMDVVVGAAKFDLYLEIDERPDGLIGRFLYSTDLFDVGTIRRMIEHWRTILEGVVQDESCELGQLPMLTPTEMHEALVDWNATAQAVPPLALHEWFEQTARGTPNAIAVISSAQSWTYGDLENRAVALAARLQEAGSKKGTLTAIGMDRSFDMVAGLLAILKTGGAYLPLDVSFPPERQSLILDDARPSVLLTQRDLVGMLPQSTARTILCDDDVEPEKDLSKVDVEPDDLAYVLYTSGSTGKPKGVEVTHRAVVNLLASMQRRPGFDANDRMLAVTTLTFDIAALEIFLPLVSGGRLIVADRDSAVDPNRLSKLIRDSECTEMQATPATWRMLLEANWSGQSGMKVLCGGEALSRDLADKLLARCHSLWNLYGPTETTIWSTIHKVEPGEGPVAIGKPVANTKIFILDERGNPAAVGVPGELLIGGAGLSRGYLNRKTLTTERFVGRSVAPGERLYRTGDIARYRADGVIECLGRTDNQIKVRGFRVEVEEIEAYLQKHTNVSAAAVKAWPDASGENSLIGYIVVRREPAPSSPELRKYLQQSLPDYMIPPRFVMLPALPTTPNRKIDRNALPEPTGLNPNLPIVEPRTDIEVRLAAIWKDILGVPAVSANDNFFDLGGHSLLVVHLLHRIEAEFGRVLSIASIFHTPQLHKLAALLGETTETSRLPRLIAVQPKGSRPPIFWIDDCEAIRPLAEALGPDQPFFNIMLGSVASTDLTPRFTDIAADVARILRVQARGPFILGGYCTHGLLAYEVASQLRAQGQKVELVIMLDSRHPQEFIDYLEQRPWLAHKLNRLMYHSNEFLCLRGPSLRRHVRNWLVGFLQRLPSGLAPSRFRRPTREVRLDNAALDYRPLPYAGNVTLLQPRRRPDLIDYRSAWKGLLQDRLVIKETSGNHETFIEYPNLSELAACINASLLQVTRPVIRME
jgi:amino acid adenylation domain-containing protein